LSVNLIEIYEAKVYIDEGERDFARGKLLSWRKDEDDDERRNNDYKLKTISVL
jgi:hypothetical protein